MMVIGITKGLNEGVTIKSPSTADKTLMAGVITPSPYNNPAAKIRRGKIAVNNFLSDFLDSKLTSAKTPPSPS